MMQNIQKRIRDLYPLSEASFNKIASRLTKVELPRGHVLFQANRIETSIYFLEKGVARAYCYDAEKEITFWFGFEGDVIFSYNSYVNNEPGYENVALLEDAALYSIDNTVLQALFLSDLEIANWGRKLAERELIRTEKLFISRQFRTASERYHELLKAHPQLVQRVQLGHIASYLGITQVTLSRIRAENS